MAPNVYVPILGSSKRSCLRLVAKTQDEFAPVSARFSDVIGDPDTAKALFIAWEAARCRWGAVVDGLSIDLSQSSYEWLRSRTGMIEGDSISLAAFLAIAAYLQRFFPSYVSIVATGAIDKCAQEFRVRGVGEVKQKIRRASGEHPSSGVAIVVPQANCGDVDVQCYMQDIWLAGPDLGYFDRLRHDVYV